MQVKKKNREFSKKNILLLASVFGVFGIAVSCITPTLPVPPPVVDDFSLQIVDPENHLIKLTERNNSGWVGSDLYIINSRTGYGTITPVDDNGSFETQLFEAQDQDELKISYRAGEGMTDWLCAIVDYAKNALINCY